MSNYLIYSVLRYKHDLVLGELLNVGILFYFPTTNKFQFVCGDGSRAKAIYPVFDSYLFSNYLDNINNKISNRFDLFIENPSFSNFSDFIHKFILPIDASGFIFGEPVQIQSVFDSTEKTVDEFSRLLLPGINVAKPKIVKYNEAYISKIFKGYLFGKDSSIEKKINKNQPISTKHFTLNFEFSYQSSVTRFIKPISFDFTDEASIQNKSALYFGYLAGLSEFANSSNSVFDFLVAKPNKTSLISAYENAIDFLESSNTPKSIIPLEQLESYSSNLLSEL